MVFDILNLNGEKVNDMNLDDLVFGIEPNHGVVRQAVLAELTNMRQGTHMTKNRALVRGGGRKPWKQKGRGVARAGTIRSPLWKGGGTIFGPEPHAYNHKLSKKISKLARKSVLSEKAANGSILIVENFSIATGKTSELISKIHQLKLIEKKIVLLIEDYTNAKLIRASKNLSKVSIVKATNASVYNLMNCDVILLDMQSAKSLMAILKT